MLWKEQVGEIVGKDAQPDPSVLLGVGVMGESEVGENKIKFVIIII